MLVRVTKGLALTFTGLLSGAFAYGAINLGPTFWEVPLQMRLSFHAQLMTMNSPVMQTAMVASSLSSLALAVQTHGRERLLAGGAAVLTVASFFITRFGNVPINGRIKQWAVTSAPADHVEILQRWDMFNRMRTSTALIAFILLVVLAVAANGQRRKTGAEASGTAGAGRAEA
ncbi:anthrone oxygenase family protein [Streptomyces sp. NPDC014894]|uniref:anthrone oxygenase family protein n=1 Tax=Streptomyces sp. NPDC014894 TaxID=3364931 RepID=UPI0036F633A1